MASNGAPDLPLPPTDKAPSGENSPTDTVEQEPKYLPGLLKALPDSDDGRERIKRLLDENKTELGEYWQKRIEDWLRLNSSYYLDNLIAAAVKAKDKEGWSITHEEEVRALAKFGWPAAEPVLEALTAGGQPNGIG